MKKLCTLTLYAILVCPLILTGCLSSKTPTVTGTPGSSVTSTQTSVKESTATTTSGPTPSPTPTIPSYTIDEAISQGIVQVEINGQTGLSIGGVSSGDVIVIRFQRQKPEEMEIIVPLGTTLNCQDQSKQNMVILELKGSSPTVMGYHPADKIILTGDDWQEYLFEAYCLDMHKDNIHSNTAFSVGKLASSEVIATLSTAVELGSETATVPAIQSAVWALTNDPTRAELLKRFSVSDQGLVNARTILERAGINPASFRLFADFTPTPTPSPTATAGPTPTATPAPPPVSRPIADAAVIGTDSGLNVLDGNGWWALDGGLPNSHIIDIAVDQLGTLWVAHWDGVSAFDGTEWINHSSSQWGYGTPSAIFIDSNDRILVAHHDGLSILDDGQWTTYNSAEFGLGELASLVTDVTVNDQGVVWVATQEGIACFDGSKWKAYDESAGLTSKFCEVLAVDQQGRVWIGHGDGLEVFDGSKWTCYGANDWAGVDIVVPGLSQVQALAVDDRGWIWAGTYSQGVSVFDGNSWKTYDRGNSDFRGGAVEALACDGQGRVWIATDIGLAVFDGSQWNYYTATTSDLPTDRTEAVAIVGEGPPFLPPPVAAESGAVTGRVLQGGQPLPGALVQICWRVAWPLYFGDTPCEGEKYGATTDANGYFRVDGIPPGKYEIAIQTSDGKWYSRLMSSIYVIEGETVDIGELSIR